MSDLSLNKIYFAFWMWMGLFGANDDATRLNFGKILNYVFKPNFYLLWVFTQHQTYNMCIVILLLDYPQTLEIIEKGEFTVLQLEFHNNIIQIFLMNYHPNEKSSTSKETDTDLADIISVDNLSYMKDRLLNIQNTIRKWEKNENWTYSKQRQELFNLIFSLQNVEKTSAIKTNQAISEADQSKTTQETTDSSLPQYITQKALKKQRELMRSCLSVAHLRRPFPKKNQVVQISGNQYYVMNNLIQATYFCLFDMFESVLKQPFTNYKYMVLQQDISWLNNNRTLQKKYRYLNEDLFKRLVIDYYAIHQKYSTKEILQNYDLDFVIEAYFRAVLRIKGKGTPQNMQDFSKVPRWNELANYFAKHCISRFKCIYESDECTDINIEIVDKIFSIKLQKNGVYLKVY